MNYKKTYSNIIRYRKNNKLKRKGNEQHHIVPRSLGGSNKLHNRVTLTPKEHYICHLLLTKIAPKGSPAYYSMIHAWNMMSAIPVGHVRYKMSKGSLYEKLKREYSKSRTVLTKGAKNPNYNKIWIRNLNTKESIQINKKDRIPDDWERGKYSDNLNRKYFANIVNMETGKTSTLYDTSHIPILHQRGTNYNHVLKMDILNHYKKIIKHKNVKSYKPKNKVLNNFDSKRIDYNNFDVNYIKELFESYKKCKNFKEFSKINNFNKNAKVLYKLFNIYIPEYNKYKRNGKKKVTIDGITYNSHTEAVKATKIAMECIIKYEDNGIFNREVYEQNCYKYGILPKLPINNKNYSTKCIRGKSLIIDDNKYNSYSEASKITKIALSTLKKHVKNGIFNRKEYEESCFRCNKTPKPPLKKLLY